MEGEEEKREEDEDMSKGKKRSRSDSSSDVVSKKMNVGEGWSHVNDGGEDAVLEGDGNVVDAEVGEEKDVGEDEDADLGENEDVNVGENEDVVGDGGEAALDFDEYMAAPLLHTVKKHFAGDYNEVLFQHRDAADLFSDVNRHFQALNEVTLAFHALHLEREVLLNERTGEKKLIYVVRGEGGWKEGFNTDVDVVVFKKREGGRITFGLDEEDE